MFLTFTQMDVVLHQCLYPILRNCGMMPNYSHNFVNIFLHHVQHDFNMNSIYIYGVYSFRGIWLGFKYPYLPE